MGAEYPEDLCKAFAAGIGSGIVAARRKGVGKAIDFLVVFSGPNAPLSRAAAQLELAATRLAAF